MPDARSNSLLALAGELERRDEEQAAAIAELEELQRQVARVRDRAAEVRDFLTSLPGELARLESAEADARPAVETAAEEVERADGRLADLESRRRADAAALATARSEATQAREALSDAKARVSRLHEQRAALVERERQERDEIERLEAEAREVAARLRGVGRLSEAGRADPQPGLDGLIAWGDRVHAALLVARGTLEREHERTVEEANELGAAVLGEQVGLAGVALVRERLERALRN